MAILVWPASLPQQVLRDDFTDTYSGNTVTTSLDIGTPQTRPRGTFSAEQYNCTITCTRQQKIVFDNFYKNTTLSGTQTFELPDFYVSGAVINVKFDAETGVSIRSLGGDWLRITFKLNQQPY